MNGLESVKSIGKNLKNPAHTGERRCLPCTIVNLFLAIAVAASVGAITGGASVTGATIAIITFAMALGIIFLRGYLIPGTPSLTKQYLPERVLALFDAVEPPPNGPRDPETELLASGIVEVDPTLDDLVLTPEFERAWLESIVNYTTEEDVRVGIANLMDLGPALVDVDRRPTSFVAYHDGSLVAKWESRAACQADVSAGAVVARFDREWYDRPVLERLDLLATLRLFIEECPACGGEVSFSHEVVESCCRSHDVVATTCEACTARLFETPIDVSALEPDESDEIETG